MLQEQYEQQNTVDFLMETAALFKVLMNIFWMKSEQAMHLNNRSSKLILNVGNNDKSNSEN